MGIFGSKCVRCGRSLPDVKLGTIPTCDECAGGSEYDPMTDRLCPRDGRLMYRDVVWDVLVYGCPTCRKMWVDPEELDSPNEALDAAI